MNSMLGKENAQKELKIALSNDLQHNLINNGNILIKDSATAISIAEPILFNIYKKKGIESQKPYETYLLDNYWIISGTLPKDSFGGTFLIIIDATNAKILKITHGR